MVVTIVITVMSNTTLKLLDFVSLIWLKLTGGCWETNSPVKFHDIFNVIPTVVFKYMLYVKVTMP